MPMQGPTTDHEEIRSWAVSHRGVPAQVMPAIFNGEPAILRFFFGKASKGTPELKPITWESFFAQFDLLGLAFVYDPDEPLYEILQIEAKSAYRVLPHP